MRRPLRSGVSRAISSFHPSGKLQDAGNWSDADVGRVAAGNVGADCNHRSMNAILLLVGLLVGAAIGAALGYLLARQRLANLAADLSGQTAAAQERAKAAAERAALLERAALEKAALVDG